MASGQSTQPLAPHIGMTELISVLEQNGPVKTTLQDFCVSPLHREVTATCIVVEKVQNTRDLIIFHDLVGVVFE